MMNHVRRHPITRRALAGLIPAALLAQTPKPSKVEIRKQGAGFRLLRNGEPYFIKGAVFPGDQPKFPMRDLAACGANSIRASTRLLDEARSLGLSVLVNLPMRMESVHKFDYNDERAVADQFEANKKRVLQFKDHPAVLMWAIGNELSVGYKNKKVWNAVNDVAHMIHDVDGNHLCMTIIGDGSIRDGDIRIIRERAPDLDLLGINYYMGVENVPRLIRENGWDKPYAVTEWGPSGDWQAPKTEWKASIEETSTEKAERYIERYRAVMEGDHEHCLGSYAFIWQWRHERTQTWYGMFLESGERTEAANAMQCMWTGKWPANRAPRVSRVRIDGHEAADSVYVKPGTQHTATLEARDPEGDPLAMRWEVLAEVARAGYAGMGEKPSKPIPGLMTPTGPGQAKLTAPEQEGAYRLFVFITDDHGNGATANIPFFVKA